MKWISRDAWNAAQLALMRYKENHETVRARIDFALSKNPDRKGNGGKPLTSDRTATAAIKLTEDPIYQRANREIQAVDAAIRTLTKEERKIIELRYFRHKKGVREPEQYRYINAGYSIRQMKRVNRKVIDLVANYLGEE